jgi:hypothetical protein
LRQGEGCYRLTYERVFDEQFVGHSDFEVDLRFLNGVHLQAYSTVQNDSELCATLLWEITVLPQTEYFFAVHYFDEVDRRIAQADRLSWESMNWQIGDRVVSQFCVNASDSEVTRIDVGMYTFVDGFLQGIGFVNDGNIVNQQMLSLPVAR